MRPTKVISCWLAICLALFMAACQPEKEEVTPAQGQVDKARAAADAASRVASRTDEISATADGEEEENEDEEP